MTPVRYAALVECREVIQTVLVIGAFAGVFVGFLLGVLLGALLS